MSFRVQRAKGTISGQAPGVRADIDVRTGGQTLARAISGMGGAIFDMGRQLYAKDAKIKSDDAEMSARLSMVRFLQEIRNEDDVSKWDKLFSQHGQRVMKARPKHKGAAAQYDSSVKKMVPAWQEIFTLQREAKLEDDMIASSIVKVDKKRKGATFDSMGQTIKDIRAELKLRDKLSFSISRADTEILLADVARDVQVSAAKKAAMNNPEELLSKIKGSKIEGFSEITNPDDVLQIKNVARQTFAETKRNLAEQKKIMQEQTASKLLADFWENKLTDPQVITDAVRSGLITDTDGKYLREALLNPKPPTLNLKNLADVKEAIVDIGTGAKTRSQALEVLYMNLSGIDPTTGKSLVAEIFAKQDKGDAEMKREGRSLMEDIIRDKDPMSGFFTDDARQILGTSEAILMLDAAIAKAAKAGKPLTRREILIRAVETGQQIKAKIKREEADAIPPEFNPETEGHPVAPRAPDFTAKGKPIRKGAIPNPDFALDSEGEPEKVFDSKGREMGLRRKSGAVFGIGYHAIFDGKKYEYTGNGNWILVK